MASTPAAMNAAAAAVAPHGEHQHSRRGNGSPPKSSNASPKSRQSPSKSVAGPASHRSARHHPHHGASVSFSIEAGRNGRGGSPPGSPGSPNSPPRSSGYHHSSAATNDTGADAIQLLSLEDVYLAESPTPSIRSVSSAGGGAGCWSKKKSNSHHKRGSGKKRQSSSSSSGHAAGSAAAAPHSSFSSSAAAAAAVSGYQVNPSGALFNSAGADSSIIRSGHNEFNTLYASNDVVTGPLTVNVLNAPNNSTMQCGCENVNCPFCNLMLSIQKTDPSVLQ